MMRLVEVTSLVDGAIVSINPQYVMAVRRVKGEGEDVWTNICFSSDAPVGVLSVSEDYHVVTKLISDPFLH